MTCKHLNFVSWLTGLCFLIPMVLSAQAEKEGFQHLLLMGSAQYSGSGESNSGRITGSETVFLHGFVDPKEVKNEDARLSYQQLMDGIAQYTITTRLMLWGQPIQAGWQFMETGNIEYRTKPGPSESAFNVYWLTVALGTQFQLGDHTIAITGKYSRQDLFLSSNEAWLTDLTWSHLDARRNGLMLVSFQNIGVSSRLENQQSALPLRVKTAFQFYDWKPAPEIRLFLVGELSYAVESGLPESSLGVESELLEILTLRTGYRPYQDVNPFSAGFSLKYHPYMIHYAFNYQVDGFPSSHGLTVGFLF